MEKITKRMMYSAIAANAADITLNTEDGVVTISAEDVKAFAENEINLLDSKAEKAKARAAAKRAEGDTLTETVFSILTDEPMVTADITAKVGLEDVTVAKVSYRLTQLVKAGRAMKSEVTIPATETSKARKVAAYQLA